MTPSLSPQNLVNTLMNMYNSNARQIENLQQANMAIRSDITTILLRIINNNNHSNNNSNSNYNSNYNSSHNTYSNNSNSRRLRSHDNNQRENISSTFNSVFQSFFEPIQIFPTPTQIENAVRIARFSDIVTPINNSCPIILERFNDNDNVSVIRNCNHIFNTTALNSWFTSNCRCPVCRYDIRNYNASNANINENTNINANANDTTNINTNTNATTNINATTNANATTNTNISNIQYDVTSDSVTFDINNDDFYNNLTRLALNSLYGINNNVRDASGNNVRDASGNNVRDQSGNQT